MKPNQAKPNLDARQRARLAAMDRIRERARSTPIELADRVCAGDRVALSEAITLVESRRRADRESAERLLDAVLSMSTGTDRSLRVGITGIPGVGKSTLIEQWGQMFIERGHRVAVLAVDPSSGRSHGSVLGDKTRMSALALHPQAFVRPSPAADALGGVARATHEVMLLCEAAGFDRVLVETVGVGQSETAVRNMTDIFVLLLLGRTGDELQGIKRGIMEMADLVWVNKADGDGEPAAVEAAQALRHALHLMPLPAHGEVVDVLMGSGLTGLGLAQLTEAVEGLGQTLSQSHFLQQQREAQRNNQFEAHVRHALWEEVMNRPGMQQKWQQLQSQVQHGQTSAFSAARSFVEGLDSPS